MTTAPTGPSTTVARPEFGTPEFDLWAAGARAEAEILKAKIGDDSERKQGIGYLLALAEAEPNASLHTLISKVVYVFDLPVLPVKRRRRWPKVTIRFAWYDMWIGAYADRAKRTLYVCPLPCVLLTVTAPRGSTHA